MSAYLTLWKGIIQTSQRTLKFAHVRITQKTSDDKLFTTTLSTVFLN